MSRNVKDFQRLLFSRIADAANDSEYALNSDERSRPRWVSGGLHETKALAKAKIRAVEYYAEAGVVALVSHETDWYAITSKRMPEDLHAPGLLDTRVDNAGLLCLVFGSPDVPLKITDKAEVREYIGEKEGAFSINEISRFFPPLFASRLTRDFSSLPSAAVWSTVRAWCAMSVAPDIAAPWGTLVANELRGLMGNKEACAAIGGHILHGVLAATWHHCFLELYRGVEVLYRVKCIGDLRADIPSIDCHEARLAKAIENSLSWRMRDDQVLVRVLNMLPKSVLSRLGQLLCCESVPDRLGARLYKARNAVVHGRISEHILPPEFQVKPQGLIEAILVTLRETHNVIRTPIGWFAEDT